MDIQFYIEGLNDAKRNQLKYADLLASSASVLGISQKTVDRALHCGTYLDAAFTEDYEKSRLLMANFCREKLCPIDLHIRSDMLGKQLSAVVSRRPAGTHVIFMTVTAPNCSGDDLRGSCRRFSKAVNKIAHLPCFSSVQGYFWSLEVTYNEQQNTYHPHLHMFLVLPEGVYISRSLMLVQFTARFLGVKEYKRRIVSALGDLYGMDEKESKRYVLNMLSDSVPWLTEKPSLLKNGLHFGVYLEAISDKKGASKYVSKYSVKPADYLSHGSEVFQTFYTSLKGLHMHAYSGCLKTLAKEYSDEYDEQKREDDTPYAFRLLFGYSGTYKIIERLGLSVDGSQNALPCQLNRPSSEDYKEHARMSHEETSAHGFVSRVRSVYNEFLESSVWENKKGEECNIRNVFREDELPDVFCLVLARQAGILEIVPSDNITGLRFVCRSPLGETLAIPEGVDFRPYVSAPRLPDDVLAVFSVSPVAFSFGRSEWSDAPEVLPDLTPVRPGVRPLATWDDKHIIEYENKHIDN